MKAFDGGDTRAVPNSPPQSFDTHDPMGDAQFEAVAR